MKLKALVDRKLFRQRMERRGLTWPILAAVSGRHEQSIRHYAAGKTEPTVRVAYRLARALRLDGEDVSDLVVKLWPPFER